MKKKVNFKLLVSLLVGLLLVGFIIYKFNMLQKYKTEHISIDNNSIFSETINVKYNQNSDTIIFEKMSYFNYFSDYVNKENTDLKVKYNENGEVSSFYNIAREKQYIHLLNINSFMLDGKNKNYSTEKSMKKFLNDKQIKDDIDLIKYIKGNYYLNNNFFITAEEMKNNYIINSFVQVTLPKFDSITLINGDKIKGYIINAKSTTDVKEIHLLYNDDQYIITLSGNELTNTKFINNLLESIGFN